MASEMLDTIMKLQREEQKVVNAVHRDHAYHREKSLSRKRASSLFLAVLKAKRLLYITYKTPFESTYIRIYSNRANSPQSRYSLLSEAEALILLTQRPLVSDSVHGAESLLLSLNAASYLLRKQRNSPQTIQHNCRLQMRECALQCDPKTTYRD
jgi:hypothetical protein